MQHRKWHFSNVTRYFQVLIRYSRHANISQESKYFTSSEANCANFTSLRCVTRPGFVWNTYFDLNRRFPQLLVFFFTHVQAANLLKIGIDALSCLYLLILLWAHSWVVFQIGDERHGCRPLRLNAGCCCRRLIGRCNLYSSAPPFWNPQLQLRSWKFSIIQ